MINFEGVTRTTLLLVDDNTQHLELCALSVRLAGFAAIAATSPIEAISILNEGGFCRVDVAVIDYHMPGMNGCILADYLKDRCPDLKIILYSGVLDIPEDEMRSVDMFVSKSDGIRSLLAKIKELRQVGWMNSTAPFAGDNVSWIS